MNVAQFIAAVVLMPLNSTHLTAAAKSTNYQSEIGFYIPLQTAIH